MIESKTVEEILNYLCNDLGGEWLLTGGSLVRLKFDAQRGTEDMDLVGITHPALSDTAARNELYRWLIGRGLGPEWVNTAVEPFVREVPQWESETVEIQRGPKGRIVRPTLTLFVFLKLRRGTDVDLEDIRKAVVHCPEKFDETKFLLWADARLQIKFRAFRSMLAI